MRTYQCTHLMFLVLCVSRTSCLIDEPTDEDYSGNFTSDIEDYEESKEMNTPISVTSTTPSIIDVPLTSSSTIQPPTTVKAEKPSCPTNCKCSDVFRHVNCSHQILKSIPDNLPLNLVHLDLSHNALEHLNVTELNKYTEIRDLIIRNNSIAKIINGEDFINLKKLQTIDLIANKLQPLNGAELAKATNLAHLRLSNNSGISDSNILFAETTQSLNTLEIANCNITQLSDHIFANVPSLLTLDLRDNPLELNINTKAFKYLVKLRTLHMSAVAKEKALDLCNVLETTDVINFGNYDLSCFEFMSGSTFDESTIKSGTLTATDTDDLYKTITNASPTIKPMNKIPKKNTTRTLTPIIDEPNIQSSEPQISPVSQSEAPPMNPNGGFNAETDDTIEMAAAHINIATETIYLLLTGLIAITLIALIIGIVCRLDCCGIKTKCCRTNNNRATSQDHGRPHEEIPLNKV